MAWPDFFAACLATGFLFALVSALLGAVHVPHFHFHAGFHGTPSPLNPPTIAAFLLWFGGSGYLLSRFADWRLVPIVSVAFLLGCVGAAIVFLFFARVLIASERPLDPLDYDMTGVLGQLTGTVRPSGTGEMIFTQQGRRRGVPVRSETGVALPRGTEVIVTRYEGGIAYVRTWDDIQTL